MRESGTKIPRILFTFSVILFLGLAWAAMTSGMLRSISPTPRPPTAIGHGHAYRAVLVTGTIRPSRTYADGQVAAVEIVVSRLGSFRIADSGKGRDLKEHVGQTVTVMAMKRVDAEGRPILDVDEYSIPAS